MINQRRAYPTSAPRVVVAISSPEPTIEAARIITGPDFLKDCAEGPWRVGYFVGVKTIGIARRRVLDLRWGHYSSRCYHVNVARVTESRIGASVAYGERLEYQQDLREISRRLPRRRRRLQQGIRAFHSRPVLALSGRNLQPNGTT